jgi:phosphoribosylformylglycinamidine cyclo-ligase
MDQTYASAGVDIEKADRFVDRLKLLARRPQHKELWPAAGGYAAVYPVTSSANPNQATGEGNTRRRGSDRAIAVTTDGVGTKLLVAHQLKKFDTLGIDLVAMCANDLICVGARPNIFLDYFAVGTLEDSVADDIMKGIVQGCDETDMLLVGGETAEMPGVYDHGHFDLAGFAVGQLSRDELLDGSSIAPGQTLIAVASSGIHSNGLSLARKVLPPDEKTWQALLVPTQLYVRPLMAAREKLGAAIKGVAHITGGGWTNLFRLNQQVGFHIDKPIDIPAILETIAGHVAEEEMYRTFNMGMGLAVIVDGQAETCIEVFKNLGLNAQIVGQVTDQAKTLTMAHSSVKLKG